MKTLQPAITRCKEEMCYCENRTTVRGKRTMLARCKPNAVICIVRNVSPFRSQHFVEFTNAHSTTNAKERKQRGTTRARNLGRFLAKRKECEWAMREKKNQMANSTDEK